MRPPLRWLGGKFRIRTQLIELREAVEITRFVDPFLGAGSTLSAFGGLPFLGTDNNSDLITFHNICRSNPNEIVARATAWPDTRDAYLRVRASVPRTDLGRAARFLYLNRTAYGGMYRVNARGQFNVPYGGGGRFDHSKVESAVLEHSRLLVNGATEVADFASTLGEVGEGDLVFLDPPYWAPGASTFTRYGIHPFNESDHERLSNLATRLVGDGVPVIATLPAHPSVLVRYAGWRLIDTHASSSIPQGEVLIAHGHRAWEKKGAPLQSTAEALQQQLARP